MGNAERRRDVVAKRSRRFPPRLLHFSALFQEVGRKSGARMMYCEPSCTGDIRQMRHSGPYHLSDAQRTERMRRLHVPQTDAASRSVPAACSTRWRWPKREQFAFMTIAPISPPGRRSPRSERRVARNACGVFSINTALLPLRATGQKPLRKSAPRSGAGCRGRDENGRAQGGDVFHFRQQPRAEIHPRSCSSTATAF